MKQEETKVETAAASQGGTDKERNNMSMNSLAKQIQATAEAACK